MRTSRYVPASYIWSNAPGGWRLPIRLANELRAVFPTFFLSLIFQCFGFLYEPYAVFAFAVASVGLPAMACGHDFMHRTLSLTLSMPQERGELWRLRLKIAFFSLLPLAILAIAQLKMTRIAGVSGVELSVVMALFMLEVALALGVSPWLTIRTRSPLAGTVFTLAVPFCVYWAATFVVYLTYGDYWVVNPEALNIRTRLTFLTLLLLGAWGGFAGRRAFMRLEAVEPRRLGTFLPEITNFQTASKLPVPRKHSAMGRLIVKELRLQSMCFVPAAALAVTCWMFKEGRDLDTAQALLWGWLACVVLGAAGSAEERQLGLAEWMTRP